MDLTIAFTLAWPGDGGHGPSRLVFEGAQGFLSTHPLEEVKDRDRNAFLAGIRQYLTAEALPPDAIACAVSFDKLHNDAFAGDPNSDSLLWALQTVVELGLTRPGDFLRGWEVSCDARLFAGEYLGLPVLTFGAGHLKNAHFAQERIHITELLDSICFTSLFMLRETGSLA